MSGLVVKVLRVVIVLAVLGSVVVQAGVVALLWWDTDGPVTTRGVALVAVVVLGIGCLQVVAACVWRLLTMVRRGTVFSHAAFRYVDTITAAVAGAAVLTVAVAVIARFVNHATPGDAVPPGLVGLVCGIALVIGGVALLVHVLRTLLAQAVALDSTARRLQSELDSVI